MNIETPAAARSSQINTTNDGLPALKLGIVLKRCKNLGVCSYNLVNPFPLRRRTVDCSFFFFTPDMAKEVHLCSTLSTSIGGYRVVILLLM